MNTRTLVVALAAVGLVGAAAGYWIATQRADHAAPPVSPVSPASPGNTPATDRRVL